MNLLRRFSLVVLCCLPFYTTLADDSLVKEGDDTGSTVADIAHYLLHLGAYLGYDLTQDPKDLYPNVRIIQTLLTQSTNKVVSEMVEEYLVPTLLGAIPVNGLMPELVPSDKTINDAANKTFTNYASPSTEKISANAGLDQIAYQPDPVNQTLLNMLGTPNFTFCSKDADKDKLDACNYLYANKILSNIIGTIPPPAPRESAYFNPKNIVGVLSQLNSNSLLAPLRFSTQSATSDNTQSGGENPGLSATNQVQQAANFIRYVSGTIIPPRSITFDQYNDLYQLADPEDKVKTLNPLVKFKAREILTSYLANLRVFAARSSVGMGNLYYILSKRIKQEAGEGSSESATSQAETEFKMATHRIFTKKKKEKENEKSWVEEINHASPATVQKEIAVLLSEINYQMYLGRQQDERILMTMSVLLMQSIKTAEVANNP